MNESTDRPGVVALPPLIYLTALLLGLVLHFVFPIRLPVPAVVRPIAALVVILVFPFLFSARGAFARAGTNVNPMLPATAMVASGPYRFTRNPMYVGMAIGFAALAVASGVGWWLVLLVPVLALMHWGVILREERYLTRKFGAEYATYRKRVRRYF